MEDKNAINKAELCYNIVIYNSLFSGNFFVQEFSGIALRNAAWDILKLLVNKIKRKLYLEVTAYISIF